MTKCIKQRWPEDEELRDILFDLKFGSPALFRVAQCLFEEYVDPEICYHSNPSNDEIVHYNMAFSEWSLFDFDLGDGMTPIRRAALLDPTLGEFASSQFYSLFWVIEQNQDTCVSRLRDTITCADFLVYDHVLAHNSRWAKGILGSRLAKVNGDWRFAGQVHLHDNATSTPAAHDPAAEGATIQDPYAFIRHVEAVMGHNGIYHGTLLETCFLDEKMLENQAQAEPVL